MIEKLTNLIGYVLGRLYKKFIKCLKLNLHLLDLGYFKSSEEVLSKILPRLRETPAAQPAHQFVSRWLSQMGVLLNMLRANVQRMSA